MKMLSSKYWFVVIALLVVFTGCTKKQNPEELKEKTARATAELKSDAKAVVAGGRAGWNPDNPLNVNTPKKDQLQSLPGVTAAEADTARDGRQHAQPSGLTK